MLWNKEKVRELRHKRHKKNISKIHRKRAMKYWSHKRKRKPNKPRYDKFWTERRIKKLQKQKKTHTLVELGKIYGLSYQRIAQVLKSLPTP